MFRSMFRQLEDMHVLQENETKEMDEMRSSIQEMRTKEMDEMRSSVQEMKTELTKHEQTHR